METSSTSAAVPYVGARVPRTEDLRLLVGDSQFADDVDLPSQLHARIVRAETPHGRLLGVDTGEAERMPGVRGVFSAADIPAIHLPVRLFPSERSVLALQPLLATERVRYVGEPVAVVVATDPYLAEDAAAAVAIEVEPLPAAVDPVLAAGAGPILHESLGTNLLDRVESRHGADVEELFGAADAVVSRRLRVQRHGAVPMEPRSMTARYEPETAQFSIWGAAKVKHFNRRTVAELLAVELESVRMIECDVGGAFGARGELYPEDLLIPWLARELEAPIKWTEDRHENLVALNHSREQVWDFQIAGNRDGELLGFRAEAWFNQGAYARTHGGILIPRLSLNHAVGPYVWHGYEAVAHSVLTNKTGAGTYRGPGQFEPTFARERMIDLLAAELDFDRAEIRRRNLVRPDQLPFDRGVPDIDSGKPTTLVDGDYPRTFARLIDDYGYERMRAEAGERRARGELVGVGVTAFIEMGNPGTFEQSQVIAEPDGTFTVHVGIASVGQGVETVLGQIAADRLEVPIERVRISYRDTAVVPEGQGAFSSRATVFGGSAIVGAIGAMHEEARSRAAERLGCEPEEIAIEGTLARAERGQRSVALADLGASGAYRYEPGKGSDVLMGANLALVRVDAETGGVTVLRYGISYDVGKAINPLTLEGQIKGAAAQGIGGALLEEFAYDEDAQPLSTSFIDYALPTAVEIGEIDVFVLELGEQADDDPLAGAKGGGEGGIIGVGGTIVNAVSDALGSHSLLSLPLTPEKVKAALAEAE